MTLEIHSAAAAIARLVDTAPRVYQLSKCTVFFDAHGENGILAPTHPTSFTADGAEWRSVEAYYQASKHLDAVLRERIRTAPDALAAKDISRGVEPTAEGMESHAGTARRTSMLVGLIARSEADEAFREFLVGTGGTNIVEHHAGDCDARWGAKGSPIASGWNLQGRMLMGVRARLVAN